MRREKGEGVGRTAGRSWAVRVGGLLAVASLAGCGGGGGDSGSPAGGGTSSATGTVRVKVTDVFGDPVAGALVWWETKLTGHISAETDPDGIAQLVDAPAGTGEVCARHLVRGRSCGGSADVTLDPGQVLELSRQLEPWNGGHIAVLDAFVPPDGVGADGRSLDVTVRVAQAGGSVDRPWFDWFNGWGCEARTGAELADLGPRCVAGASGSDVSYSFEFLAPNVIDSVEEGSRSTVVGLLIDQSDAGFSAVPRFARVPGDWVAPNDPQLFAAKLFADALLPGTPLLIAGFASDTASGSASSLARRPVTFFPVEAPGFIGSRSEAIDTLNALSGLVGGGAPLYEAIAIGIEFMADRAPPGSQPALVVLAHGEEDSGCSSDSQCAASRQAIIRRASETGVRLFLVSSGSDDEYYWSTLRTAAKAPMRQLALEGGLPLGVLPGTLRIAQQWISGSTGAQDIRFRLSSDTPGAFSPGAVVEGSLEARSSQQREALGSLCDATPEGPGGCTFLELPFRVRVPDRAP